MRRGKGQIRRGDGGQALTEFAIVAPVVVCLVLFSIYFYELISVKLKAQEAARYVAWEATAYQLSDYAADDPSSKNRNLFNAARDRIEAEALTRYQDLSSTPPERNRQRPAGADPNSMLATGWEVERVRLRESEPPEVDGGFLFELGFDLGMQVAGWIEAFVRDFDNPYVAAAMPAFLRSQYDASSWGFNERGYVQADVRISVHNLLLPRRYLDRSDEWFVNRFLRRTRVTFEEHVELLADPWKLHDGRDVLHATDSGGLYREVDRIFLGGEDGRAAARGIAQVAHLAVILGGVAGGDFPDPLRPVVVSRNYGPEARDIGTVDLAADEGRARHDTSPFDVISAYRQTFELDEEGAAGRPGRGNWYMGCAEPMQLGCTDTLARDNPFGANILPPGPDR